MKAGRLNFFLPLITDRVILATAAGIGNLTIFIIGYL